MAESLYACTVVDEVMTTWTVVRLVENCYRFNAAIHDQADGHEHEGLWCLLCLCCYKGSNAKKTRLAATA